MKTTNIEFKEEVAARIKESRILAGKKQREVALALNMGITEYQKYEKGTYQLSYERLALLCQFLDVSADYLLGVKEY